MFIYSTPIDFKKGADMSGLHVSAFAIHPHGLPFTRVTYAHHTSDSQLKSAGNPPKSSRSSVPQCRRTVQPKIMIGRHPRGAIREHVCEATRMAPLVEHPHPLTKIGIFHFTRIERTSCGSHSGACCSCVPSWPITKPRSQPQGLLQRMS